MSHLFTPNETNSTTQQQGNADGIDIPRWMWAYTDEFPYRPPPPGIVPDFEHPELVMHHSLTIACSICIAMLAVLSVVRFYAKIKLARKTTLDDFFFVAALACLLSCLSLYIYMDNLGVYGHHAWDLKMKTWTKPNIVVIFILQALLPFTTWLIKATLLCLILASFRPVTWIRYMCYIGITVTFAFYFSNILVSILSCHPRGGVDRISWLVGMAKSSCGGTRGILQKYSLTSGAFNILSDFYILMIPLPAISKLHLTSRKKIGVYLIFSAGALACLMSVVCMVFRVRVYGANDVTVDSLPPFTMNVIELSIGLMITCVAPTAKLVRRSLGKTKSWVVHKLPSSRNRLDSDSETDGNFVHAVAAPKKRHLPGGLSEIDSMRTFPTMVETEKTEDSENLDNLTALPRICRHWPGSLPQRSEDNIGYAQ